MEVHSQSRERFDGRVDWPNVEVPLQGSNLHLRRARLAGFARGQWPVRLAVDAIMVSILTICTCVDVHVWLMNREGASLHVLSRVLCHRCCSSWRARPSCRRCLVTTCTVFSSTSATFNVCLSASSNSLVVPDQAGSLTHGHLNHCPPLWTNGRRHQSRNARFEARRLLA